MIKKIICNIILLTSKVPTATDKITYYFTSLMALTPIVYILDEITNWFSVNRKFVILVLFCLLINLLVGVWFHLKMKTFSWEEFIVKNCVMIAILLLAYILLESLALVIGTNVVAEGFRVAIQVSTLLYPTSKALKNLYILSNKEFPPTFIMEKLYKFEQTGDLAELYKTTYNEMKDENK